MYILVFEPPHLLRAPNINLIPKIEPRKHVCLFRLSSYPFDNVIPFSIDIALLILHEEPDYEIT